MTQVACFKFSSLVHPHNSPTLPIGERVPPSELRWEFHMGGMSIPTWVGSRSLPSTGGGACLFRSLSCLRLSEWLAGCMSAAGSSPSHTTMTRGATAPAPQQATFQPCHDSVAGVSCRTLPSHRVGPGPLAQADDGSCLTITQDADTTEVLQPHGAPAGVSCREGDLCFPPSIR